MSSLDDSFTENTFGDLSYTFLEPVPNYLTCIICYSLLKEAVATECCGKTFCEEHVPLTYRICPACRHTPLAVARNKGIDGIVNDLKVFCLNHEEGCQWKGHLCFEPNHRKGTGERACEYEVVVCANSCGADMQRRHMVAHLLKECPQRELKCEFCGTIVMAAELESHHETCSDHPVLCPHGCEVTLPRKGMEEHFTTCPELPVPCPFAGAGCNLHVKNKDLAAHMQASVVDHLSLISAQSISLREELLQVSAENTSLREELNTVKLEHLDNQCQLRLMEAKVEELSRELCTTAKQSKDLVVSVVQLKESAKSSWHRYLTHMSSLVAEELPIVFKYEDFQHDLAHDYGTYTPTFYTSHGGYRLRLVIFPDGLKWGGWMSVTAIILPGVHDDELSWPFDGSLQVEVLNQLGDYGHCSKEMDFVRFPRKWKERPWFDRKEEKSTGWGILRFINHHNLLEEVDGHRYVVDGTIYVRITRIL